MYIKVVLKHVHYIAIRFNVDLFFPTQGCTNMYQKDIIIVKTQYWC
jgi:hypothetical protein